MESFEPKKLALIRIWQILKEYSDYDHPLTQDDVARHLESDYGIVIERKAISRNISLLKEAGIFIYRRYITPYFFIMIVNCGSEVKFIKDAYNITFVTIPKYNVTFINNTNVSRDIFFS